MTVSWLQSARFGIVDEIMIYDAAWLHAARLALRV
jgi:hypothetical protein